VVGVIQNSFIAGRIKTAKDTICRGKTITDTIKSTGLFQPIVVHTIATGEKSGNLEQGLLNLADTYDEEIEMITRSLTALLEPLILLVMGLIIGFIVMAVLLPIFEINQIV